MQSEDVNQAGSAIEVMSAEQTEVPNLAAWGRVPSPVVEMLQALNRKIRHASENLEDLVWPAAPGDVRDLLRTSLADAHAVVGASTDLRALVTAYAHRVHRPRPVMAELARAQKTSSQGLVRRYGPAHVDGLAALLADEPDIGRILAGFPSLELADLVTFTGAVGEAVRRVRDAQ